MDIFKKKLDGFKKKDLYREEFYLETPQSKIVSIEGKEYLMLGSNSYLDLSRDELIIQESKRAIDDYGLGAGGSRLTTGTYILNKELQDKISMLKKTEDTLVFGSGYMTNIGVITALCDRNWVIFGDKLNHASLVDGCLLSGAKLVRYKHNDMNDLEDRLKIHGGKHNLIITDAVFSMDGDIADLKSIISLAKDYNALVAIDDAHGFGVFGEEGSGIASYLGVEENIDIHMGTLSKAIPSVGGYVSGKKDIIDYLRNTARSYIFTTGLPPVNIATSLAALDRIKNMDKERKHLMEISDWLRGKLKRMNLDVMDSETPIIPVVIGDANRCMKIKKLLMEDGIYVNAIRPPTVSRNSSRLRISLMSSHTYEELQYFIDCLEKHLRELDLMV